MNYTSQSRCSKVEWSINQYKIRQLTLKSTILSLYDEWNELKIIS